MNSTKCVLVALLMGLLSGCASIDCVRDKPRTGYALPGTETVVVGISLDENGMPKESYKDVKVHPGQKVLFAGPDEFAIIFKKRKTPNGIVENVSRDGVVLIQIPEDIFDRDEFIEEFRQNKFLTFDYGIRANGNELDPPMIIYPR